MSRNLALSITVHIDRGVTRYAHGGGGRNCISIGRDYGRSVVGALSSESRPLG